MIMRVTFIDFKTGFTDKELREMSMRPISVIMDMVVNMIMITGDISIQSFDAVNETVTGEKIQGPITVGGLGLPTSGRSRSKSS